MTNVNIHDITRIAIKAGKILLTSGAEIYRVEDTINRICKAYNVECDSFVLPTGIFITAYGSNGETITRVKRIKERTINIKKIEAVNAFSRSLKDHVPDYSEAMNTLDSIDRDRGYPFWLKLTATSVTAFAFVLLFNGTVNEGIVAAIVSAVVYFFKERVLQVAIFPFLGFFVSGIIAGGMSLLSATLISGLNMYIIIIGAIVIHLPGMAMTNGIKDALYGDITSSMNRVSEAFFSVAAISAGVALVLLVFL
ncbi:MAG: threonine/serine exporter family protein [Clostridiaceae bacterium]|jgi:uncharacterized membrane protein YjjP (DUF1212 family)|nr:threonine/serine exporter family protein [Clostridiaceae bacterium]